MTKLEQLIQELCPNGVKSYAIGELLKNKTITTITPTFKIKSIDYKSDGEIPIISQEIDYISGYFNTSDERIPAGEYVCFGDHSEHIKYVDFAFVQGADGLKIMKTNGNNLLARYFYHTASNFYKRHDNYERHFKYFSDTVIPIPPIEVQREIVRILDNFTELTVELNDKLTAELTARKQQYEYYRDRLLTFESDAKTYVLGDIATVTKLAGYEFTKYVVYSDTGSIIALRGLNVKNGKLDLTDVKYVDESDLSKLDRSKLRKGDMLFTYVGTIGQVAVIDEDDKYYLAPNVALIRCDQSILMPEYMRYYFQTSQFWNGQINRLLQSSSMQNIPMEKIRQFELTVPSLKVQERLVRLLDNFDAICTDLNIGLPAEIEARWKQYEYYRDKLLTFKNVEG